MRLFTMMFFLFLSIFIMLRCGEIIIPESESNLNVEDFESAWNHINSIYPVFEFKKIDWDSIHTVYRIRAEQAVGDEIYAVLFDLVAELKDGHAEIITVGGESFSTFTPPRYLRDEEAFDPNLTRQYFDKPLRVVGSKSIEYEFLPDNIGYVRFSTFGAGLGLSDVEIIINDMDLIINYFSEADGLIVDVRDNNGGFSSIFNQIIARLIDKPIKTESSFTVTDTIPPSTTTPAGPQQYTGPIVILINGTSISAPENFSDRLSQLDYVTLVGDTTAGAAVSFTDSMDPRYFLPSGKSIKIGWNALLRIDGELYEWNGVPPDILVPQTKADIIMKRDKQLEFAIEFLNGN